MPTRRFPPPWSVEELDRLRLTNLTAFHSLKRRNGTVHRTWSYLVMQRAWDVKVIFPIKDAASAALMLIKADCLYTAGIINEAEKQYVRSRARMFLDDATIID